MGLYFFEKRLPVEVAFNFVSVGYGLFHASKMRENDDKFFTFIYECGSQKTSILDISIYFSYRTNFFYLRLFMNIED